MPWILTGALLLCAAVLPIGTVRDVLATAAATLFEALPFLLAEEFVQEFWERVQIRFHSHGWVGRVIKEMVQLAGCGCGEGPTARSLPATAVTWLAFGPFIAITRCIAALALGWIGSQKIQHRLAWRTACTLSADNLGYTNHLRHRDQPGANLLGDLAALVPYGITAGIAAHVLPLLFSVSKLPGPLALLAGAFAGFVLAPCGLGITGIAGALRAVMPDAAIGFLFVAGICDVRSIVQIPKPRVGHAPLAYALLAIACAYIAWKGGAALVHPRFVIPLWMCAFAFGWVAVRRNARSAHPLAYVAPLLMVIAMTLGASPPVYHATATTLDDAFPGEHITFTGVVARESGSDNRLHYKGNPSQHTALVRYAITCCRADAAPIAVRLTNNLPAQGGAWVRADGVLELHNGVLELHVERSVMVPPPTDPFLYR